MEQAGQLAAANEPLLISQRPAGHDESSIGEPKLIHVTTWVYLKRPFASYETSRGSGRNERTRQSLTRRRVLLEQILSGLRRGTTLINVPLIVHAKKYSGLRKSEESPSGLGGEFEIGLLRDDTASRIDARRSPYPCIRR